MKRSVVGLLICAVAFAFATATTAQAQKPIKALLITGEDVMPAHDWAKTSPELKKILDDSKKFEVTIVEINKNPNILDSADDLKPYDVIVQNFHNVKTPAISDKAKENLLSFVRDGKGFVCFHMSSASWQDWSEWHKLVGRYWIKSGPAEKRSGHGKRGKFTVKVVAPDNPITQGIKDFEVDDELYAKLVGDEKINVLVEADSEWSKKTEPLVFTKDYGKGRVYHNCFGHDVKALENPSFRLLWARGVEWAATGKVTPDAK
jgi:hypothetical protein